MVLGRGRHWRRVLTIRLSGSPPIHRHPRRIREVLLRGRRHGHGVSRVSRTQGSRAGRRRDPRDLRPVGLDPPDDRAAREGRVRRAGAGPPVAPRRHAGFQRRGAQAHRGSRSRYGHPRSRRDRRLPEDAQGRARGPHRGDRLLLGRRPELPVRDAQPDAAGVRGVLRSGAEPRRRRAHPGEGAGGGRRERRAHGWWAPRRRGGGEAGRDRLPLRRLSRRGARIPPDAGEGRGGGLGVGSRGAVLQGEPGGAVTYFRAFSSAASRPASTSPTVTATGTAGAIPLPTNSTPSGNASRRTENWTLQFLGSGNAAASLGLPAVVSPMITPRLLLRKATSRPSPGPAVAVEVSTATCPP